MCWLALTSIFQIPVPEECYFRGAWNFSCDELGKELSGAPKVGHVAVTLCCAPLPSRLLFPPLTAFFIILQLNPADLWPFNLVS